MVTRLRTKEVINNFILTNCAVGSKIITDCWRGYNDLEALGYIHKKVNHKISFVDNSDSTIHTNTIERIWRSLKRFLKKNLRFENIKNAVLQFETLTNVKVKSVEDRYNFLIGLLKN